jgi:hypothetical protein
MGAGPRGGRVTGYGGKSRRSQPAHSRGRDKLQELVKNKQREEQGTARLLLQCSGGVFHHQMLGLKPVFKIIFTISGSLPDT